MGAGENDSNRGHKRWEIYLVLVSTHNDYDIGVIYLLSFRRPMSSTYGTSYLPTMEGTRTRFVN